MKSVNEKSKHKWDHGFLISLLTFCILFFNGCTRQPDLSTYPSSTPIFTSPTLPAPTDLQVINLETVTPTPLFQQSILRHPKPSSPGILPCYNKKLEALNSYDPNKRQWDQIDLRHCNISSLDVSDRTFDLLHSIFDRGTRWPESNRMPKNFDPNTIMENGMDPGLGVRILQERGITGKGVGIAFVDSFLLVDHQEYAQNIHLYEEISGVPGINSMPIDIHSTAVVSIAGGERVGVAPDADLFIIGLYPASSIADYLKGQVNFAFHAQAIRRIIEVNKTLPVANKIRVLSLTTGWNDSSLGVDEIRSAIDEAKNEGIFVISASLEETYGFKFNGLGRNPLADPNDFSSYEPGIVWQDYFPHDDWVHGRLLIPMDARTTASPFGYDDYVFYFEGGLSWAIPYLAGVYAMAAQVYPGITPDEFWTVAVQTGKTIEIEKDGEIYSFGPIIDPVKLIENLQ